MDNYNQGQIIMSDLQPVGNLDSISRDLFFLTESIKSKRLPNSPELNEKISEVNRELSELLLELSELEGIHGSTA